MSVDNDAAKSDGFICGAWTIREHGPILNYEQPYIREQYVYRCDLPAGHEGDHADSVLLTNWSGPTPEEVAKAKVAKAEAEVDVETRYTVEACFPGQPMKPVDYVPHHKTLEEAKKRVGRLSPFLDWQIVRIETATTVVEYQGKDK